MKIYLGSDHAGFSLKQKIKDFLEKKKIVYEDLGDFEKKSKHFEKIIFHLRNRSSRLIVLLLHPKARP